MKRAIIFYNGTLKKINKIKQIIKATDYIICADGGTKFAKKLAITPNLIIGDFDSLPSRLRNEYKNTSVQMVQYKKDKDETDSELALNYALEQGYKSIVLLGVFGSRSDHVLSNILALVRGHTNEADIVIIEGDQEIRVIRDSIQLQGSPGDLISLIPLAGNVKKVITKNLQYPLNGEDLLFGYSRGISNVMLKKSAQIVIQEGLLLVIHTKKE